MSEVFGLPKKKAELTEKYALYNTHRFFSALQTKLTESSDEDALNLLKSIQSELNDALQQIPTVYEVNRHLTHNRNFVVFEEDGSMDISNKYISGDLESAVTTARQNLNTMIEFIHTEIMKIDKERSDKQDERIKEDTSSNLIKIESQYGVADLARIFEYAIESGIISSKHLVSDIVQLAFRNKDDKQDKDKLRKTLNKNNRRKQIANIDGTEVKSRSREFYAFSKLCVLALEITDMEELSTILDKEISKRRK